MPPRGQRFPGRLMAQPGCNPHLANGLVLTALLPVGQAQAEMPLGQVRVDPQIDN